MSRQPYNVVRLKGLRKMQKTTRPRKSAARSYTMNAKYKTVFKQRHICRYENCIVGFGVVVGLIVVESAAYGGD